MPDVCSEPGFLVSSVPRRSASRLCDAAVVLLLAATVAYFFGDCLHAGPVLDDHWHQKGLRDDPWTLSGLEHTGTIDITNLLDCWWQDKPVRWRYPRPLFIAIMKAVYRACGDDPVGLHALSLLLHTLSAILIWRLALWLTGLRFWSVIAALIFAVYQHAVIPVSWPSALNTVIVTFMMLAAMMLYLGRLRAEARRAKCKARNGGQPPPAGRESRMSNDECRKRVGHGGPTLRAGDVPARDLFPVRPSPFPAPFDGGQPPPAVRGCERVPDERPLREARRGRPAPIPRTLRAFVPSCLRALPSLAAPLTVLALYCAGLLVRENMLILPVLLLAIEATFAGWRSVRRNLGFYAFFAVSGGIFLIWRIVAYGGGMPEVYLRRPHGDWGEYGVWLVAKLLHYLSVSIWPGPMVVGPTGRYNPLLERPGDFALMLALVGVAAWTYHRTTRGLAGRWIWPLWLLLAVLPVVPVIATPHSGYLVAAPVAMCVLAMLAATRIDAAQSAVASGLRARRPHGAVGSVGHGGPTLQEKARPEQSKRLRARARRRAGRRPRAWSHYAVRGMALVYLGLMALFTILHSWEWKGIAANDRYLVEQVCVDPPTPDVSDVYFINLPFANVYARWALVERLGPWFERVRVHALTFAPHPLLVESHTTVSQLDAHTLRLRIEGQPWFSRLLGRFLIEAFRTDGPFRTGQTIRGPQFDVRIVEGDAAGVRELEFRFRKRLDDPTQALYLASRESIATRLRFVQKSEERSQKSEMGAGRPRLAMRSMGASRPRLAMRSMGASRPRLADLTNLTEHLLAGDPSAAEPLLARLAAWVSPPQARPVPTFPRSHLPTPPLPGAAASHDADADPLREAREALALVGCVISECTGSDVQPLFDCPEAWTAHDIERLRSWWRRRVGWREMQDIWLRRNDFQNLIEWRDEVPHAIWWAAHAVHSDLYLTGPPFDGPRARR